MFICVLSQWVFTSVLGVFANTSIAMTHQLVYILLFYVYFLFCCVLFVSGSSLKTILNNNRDESKFVPRDHFHIINVFSCTFR